MPRSSTTGRVLNRVDLQGGKRNNAYVFRDGQRGGKWCLYFLNRETNQRHRFVLKHSNGSFPDPTADGVDDALELAQEKHIDLRTRTERGEVVNVLTIAEMIKRFLDREEKRISSRPPLPLLCVSAEWTGKGPSHSIPELLLVTRTQGWFNFINILFCDSH